MRGFQVSPSEVEGALLEHPDIIDAAVIGVPARRLADGEQPRAYVTLRPESRLTADDIHEQVRTRLAHYKQCAGGVVIGAEIPKSPSGKILKRLLVKRAEEEMAHERQGPRL